MHRTYLHFKWFLMNTFPILTTQRLILRPLTIHDFSDFYATHSSKDHMQWFGTESMTHSHEAENLIELFRDLWPSKKGIRFVIERSSDQSFLGTCGLFKWNHNWKSCAISYELSPNALGQGYMNEALHAVIQYAFKSMQINRIEAQIHPNNSSSIKTITKLGFLLEGTQRQAGYWHNTYHDLCLFSLIQSDDQVLRHVLN